MRRTAIRQGRGAHVSLGTRGARVGAGAAAVSSLPPPLPPILPSPSFWATVDAETKATRSRWPLGGPVVWWVGEAVTAPWDRRGGGGGGGAGERPSLQTRRPRACARARGRRPRAGREGGRGASAEGTAGRLPSPPPRHAGPKPHASVKQRGGSPSRALSRPPPAPSPPPDGLPKGGGGGPRSLPPPLARPWIGDGRAWDSRLDGVEG